MSSKSVVNKNYVTWLAAILFFLEFQPYFVWPYVGTPMLIAVTIPLVLILGFHSSNKQILTAIVFGVITLFAAIFEGSNLFGIIAMLMVVVLFVSIEYLQEVYRNFKLLYVYIICISMIVWLLMVLGVSLPAKEIAPLNSLKDLPYIQYPFLVKMGFDANYSIIYRTYRFFGLFDEPGTVGTIAFLMLAVDKFNLKKPSNIILMISGLLSMSLFFYLSVFLWMIYSLISSDSKKKNKVISLILFFILMILSYNNEITKEAIWNRLEYDTATGTISGDNRADEELKTYIAQIRGSSSYWFGVHDKEIIARYSNSSSMQNAVLKYGVVGCVIYFLFFLVFIYNNIPNRKNTFVCLLFLFVTLWQRPGFFLIPYVFLYLMFIVNFGKKDVYESVYTKSQKIRQRIVS